MTRKDIGSIMRYMFNIHEMIIDNMTRLMLNVDIQYVMFLLAREPKEYKLYYNIYI